jgi:hypothetical protein
MYVPHFPRDCHAAYLRSQRSKEADQFESKLRLVKKAHELDINLSSGLEEGRAKTEYA